MRFNKGYSLNELLSNIDYNDCIIGSKDSIILGFSDDYFAEDADLTWTDNELILNNLLAKPFNLTIITNIKIKKQIVNKNIVYCKNPLRLFETIVDSCFVWPNKNVEIGQNSSIHTTAIIGKNVSIGKNCKISPYVVIGDNVTIGNNVEIESFSTIGNAPYYTLWNQNNKSRIRSIYGCVNIKNNVRIGSYCSIDNGITGETVIGSGCKLGNFVEISHDVRVGNNCHICTQTAICGLVSIGNDCVFWGRSGVTNRIKIAPRTTLLASSVLTKSVLIEGQTFCGFPAMERIKYWKKIAQTRNQ